MEYWKVKIMPNTLKLPELQNCHSPHFDFPHYSSFSFFSSKNLISFSIAHCCHRWPKISPDSVTLLLGQQLVADFGISWGGETWVSKLLLFELILHLLLQVAPFLWVSVLENLAWCLRFPLEYHLWSFSLKLVWYNSLSYFVMLLSYSVIESWAESCLTWNYML